MLVPLGICTSLKKSKNKKAIKMQDITYTINVNDLIEALKEYEYVKIEFYKDGDFTIMDENACGYPDKTAHIEHFCRADLEECGKDINVYTDWLGVSWMCGVEVYDGVYECAYNIHVNWVK